jgi:thiol-disulfide isomerase/thioredoxin
MTLKSLLASGLVLLGAISAAFAEATWLTNFEEAKKIALKEGKPILLDFTGSDWCPPCKALHKNVFSTEEFAKEAAGKYVLVELDFPRTKQIAPEVKAQNSELQKKYAITGFPTVLLVDAKTGEVFGRTVQPDQLIHADKHGFLAVPAEDESRLLEAARFMDSNECTTVIPAARESVGLGTEELLTNLEASINQFSANVKAKFSREGEW